MADVQDLDDIIELASVGEDTPPAAVGSRGTAHITGADPTGKWAGNPNALAIDSGDGSFDFKDAAEMKKHLYFWEDALQSWNGTALEPLTGGGEAPAPPADELPADPTTDGAYTLKCTVTGGVAAKEWIADAPAGFGTQAGRSGGPGGSGDARGGAPGGRDQAQTGKPFGPGKGGNR